MKNRLNLSKIYVRIIFSFLFLSITLSSTYGQCSSDVILSSQKDVDNFACSSIGGNLTIEGADITNLNPLANNAKLSVVKGNLTIQNCPKLESLEGLNVISEITGWLVLNSNPALSTLGGSGWQLKTIGGAFGMEDCPNLTGLFAMGNVSTIAKGIRFGKGTGVEGFSNFNSLITCPIVQFNQTNTAAIDGFEGISTCALINFDDNPQLEKITGFGSLKSIAIQAIDGQKFQILSINNNPALRTVDAFQNLSSVAEFNLSNNKNLGDCCFMLDIMDLKPDALTINNNGANCGSASAIDAAPVLSPCPLDFKVTTDPGVCHSVVNLVYPTVFDNCDLQNYDLRFLDLNDNLILEVPISSGASAAYQISPGEVKAKFIAQDARGNQSSCFTPITVVDGEPAVLSTGISDQSLSTGSSSCVGTYQVTFPQATDNCGVTRAEITIYKGGNLLVEEKAALGQNFSFQLEPGIYDVEVFVADANNQGDASTATVTVSDNTPPTIGGIPASVTINCNDAFPSTPSPSASDNCDGAISNFTVSSSISTGTCTLNEVAEIQEFVWNITDNAGNSASAMWKVTVISDFSFELGDDVALCEGGSSYTIDPGNIGNSYTWSTGSSSQSITVNSSGNYAVTITSNNGCCYSDNINVNLGTTPDASATGGVLGCTDASVQITGSSTTGGASFSWSGPNGFTSNQQNTDATSIGEYTLTVTSSDGCTSSTVVTVSADTDVPDVSATGGQISCQSTLTQINGTSTTSEVNYQWSGPNGFSSAIQNPNVTEVGSYTLVVTATNGCSSSATVEVTSDSSLPQIGLSVKAITCENPEVTINFNSGSDISTYAWTGPDNFSSNIAEPTINTPGTYQLTVVGTNGCSASVSLNVNSDLAVPNVSASGGTISCSNNSTMLTASSTTADISFLWTGPDNFVSTLPSPVVSQPGSYTVSVFGSNGCSSSTTVEVTGDEDIPNVSAEGGTIDCNNNTVTLMGSTNSTNASFSWTGPNGFSTTDANPTIDFPGTYTFTVTSENACSAFETVEVNLDRKDPDLSLAEGETDCAGGERSFDLRTDALNAIFSWTGPNGFVSNEQNPKFENAGEYSVMITGTNGCITSGKIKIDFDINYEFELHTDGSNAEIIIMGGTPPFEIKWDNGTTGSATSGLSFGEHSLEVLDGLGCTKFFIFNTVSSGTKDINSLISVQLAPNPARDNIKVSWDSFSGYPERISIISIDGSTINKTPLTLAVSKGEQVINITGISPGIYFISLEISGRSVHRKFIKI